MSSTTSILGLIVSLPHLADYLRYILHVLFDLQLLLNNFFYLLKGNLALLDLL
ncbi:hypothetical protein [Thermococcus gammatolerans]|uniref:hypothetical protein n=1 Tax=Thermococcus gammatolerans TaxID=187878 RepID=UPI000AFBE3D0|nr:hypothetical protein [Thermococcus gammatolerans]